MRHKLGIECLPTQATLAAISLASSKKQSGCPGSPVSFWLRLTAAQPLTHPEAVLRGGQWVRWSSSLADWSAGKQLIPPSSLTG